MKIALFGGTFDPIHSQHFNVCTEAKKQFAIDKVIVLPSGNPPHKSGGKISASAFDRYQMAKLAFEGEEGIEVSDYEVNKAGPCYTYHTLKYFMRKYSGEFYLIIGADSLINFKSWFEYKKILALCSLIVCARGGEDDKKFAAAIDNLSKEAGKKIYICDYKGGNVSSTALKVFLEFGIDCKEFLSPKVLNYIKEKKLYSGYGFYISKLKKMLSPKRYTHTVYTVISALKLAEKTGCDREKTFLAAALHDCTKKLPDKELKNLGFVLTEDVPEPVAHSVSGKYVARTVFKIKDRDILNSIRFHTTGRKGMSLLEKVIYVADCIEQTRDFEGVEELRKAVDEDFEKGFVKCMELTIKQLKENANKGKVSDITEKAYRYYAEKIKKRGDL